VGSGGQAVGVSSEGSGFRGLSFHSVVSSSEAVDEVMGNAVVSGGGVVKESAGSEWGSYFGYLSDPDCHLWKVASGLRPWWPWPLIEPVPTPQRGGDGPDASASRPRR